MKKLGIYFLLLGLAACNRTSFTSSNLVETQSQVQELEEQAKAQCDIPWSDTGETLEAGQKIKAYKQSSTCGDSCDEFMIYRECRNGVLTGSNEYRYSSCQTNSCQNCSLPWGPSLSHGQEIDAFKQAEVACLANDDDTITSCTDPRNRGSITCLDGELIGIEEFPSPTCRSAKCGCAVPWDPEEIIPNGETLDAFKSNTAPCVYPCENSDSGIPGFCGPTNSCQAVNAVQLTCSDGAFVAEGRVWSPNEVHGTCEVQECVDCFAGPQGFKEHGESITEIYERDLQNPDSWVEGIPPCDQTCDQNQGEAICVNGAWLATDGPSDYWNGFLDSPAFSCGYPQNACSCEIAGLTLNQGDTETLFRAPEPNTCDETCSPDYEGTVTCEFGQLQLVQGSGEANDYQFQTCTEPNENPNCFCTDPFTGGQILHGDSLSPIYTQSAPACAQSCSSVFYGDGSIQCLNGEFEGSPNFDGLTNTCDEEEAYCDCPHPGGPGLDDIVNGQTVELWREPVVPCAYAPGSCAEASPEQAGCRSEQRTCNNGVLSGSDEFINPSCDVDCVFCDLSSYDRDSCSSGLPEGGPNPLGQLIEMKPENNNCSVRLSSINDVLECGENCGNYTAEVVCQRVGDSANLILNPDNPDDHNPAGLTLAQLNAPADCCTQLPEGSVCSTGGNPTRACSLPGDWNLLTGDQTAAGMYRSRQERPPHTRFPWSSGDPYFTHNYLEHYVLFAGTPQQKQYPYGFRTFEDQSWFYQVSPQTIVTFYDTPIVQKTLDGEESCDQRAIVKRCHPDGFWYPLSGDMSDVTLGESAGPSLEPEEFHEYQYTSCRTVEDGEPNWSETDAQLAVDGLICLLSDNPGACIFNKNPFADNNQTFVDETDYNFWQRRDISWTDESFSGLLQSESFRVIEVFTKEMGYGQVFNREEQPDGTIEIVDVPGAYCKYYETDVLPDSLAASPDLSDTHRVDYNTSLNGPAQSQTLLMENEKDYPSIRSQLFYGLEWIQDDLMSRFGADAIHFEYRSLNVIQGDPLFSNNAALVRSYDPFLVFGQEMEFKRDETGNIVLNANGQPIEVFGRPFSFDLSVVAHELAHANLYFGAQINDNGETITCGTDDITSLCCSSTRGCIRAIDEGQADFFSSIVFPDSPAMGDGLAHSHEGIKSCGIPRNPELNASLTVTEAYNACSADFAGQVHAFGTIYSSAWWVLRDQQSTQADKTNVERLFLEHIKYLDSTSDYCSSLAAVAEAEINLFGTSNLSNAFEFEMIENRQLNCD